jgi:hypothetical protein
MVRDLKTEDFLEVNAIQIGINNDEVPLIPEKINYKTITIAAQEMHNDAGYHIKIISKTKIYLYSNDTVRWQFAISSMFRTKYPDSYVKFIFRFFDINNNRVDNEAIINIGCAYNGANPDRNYVLINKTVQTGLFASSKRMGVSFDIIDPIKCNL